MRTFYVLSYPFRLIGKGVATFFDFIAVVITGSESNDEVFSALFLMLVQGYSAALVASLKLARNTFLLVETGLLRIARVVDSVLDFLNGNLSYALDNWINNSRGQGNHEDRDRRILLMLVHGWFLRAQYITVFNSYMINAMRLIPAPFGFFMHLFIIAAAVSLGYFNAMIAANRYAANELSPESIKVTLALRATIIRRHLSYTLDTVKGFLMLPLMILTIPVMGVRKLLISRYTSAEKPRYIQRTLDYFEWLRNEYFIGLYKPINAREFDSAIDEAIRKRDLSTIFKFLQDTSGESYTQRLINWNPVVAEFIKNRESKYDGTDYWSAMGISAEQVTQLENNNNLYSFVHCNLLKVPVKIITPPQGHELQPTISRQLDLMEFLRNSQKRYEQDFEELDPGTNRTITGTAQITLDVEKLREVNSALAAVKWRQVVESNKFAEFLSFLQNNKTLEWVSNEAPRNRLDIPWTSEMQAAFDEQIANTDAIWPEGISPAQQNAFEQEHPDLCSEISHKLMRHPVGIKDFWNRVHFCELLEMLNLLVQGKDVLGITITSFNQFEYAKELEVRIAKTVQTHFDGSAVIKFSPEPTGESLIAGVIAGRQNQPLLGPQAFPAMTAP